MSRSFLLEFCWLYGVVPFLFCWLDERALGGYCPIKFAPQQHPEANAWGSNAAASPYSANQHSEILPLAV